MNDKKSLKDLTDTMRLQFTEMSTQLQAAARYVLDHPQEVAVDSMRTIAMRAGVQPATMVRLAQALGFEGWSALRDIHIGQILTQPEPYATRARELVRNAEPRTLIAESFQAQHANLAHAEAQNPQSMLNAASLLANARTVHVAGFRACYSIAFTFHYLYRFFRSSVSLLNGEAGMLELQLRAICQDDVTVIISFAPYSQESRAVVHAAKEQGSRIIAITDSTAAPIALAADETILFSVGSPSFFPSITSGVAVVEALIETVMAQSGEAAVSQIRSAERQLRDLKAYDAD